MTEEQAGRHRYSVSAYEASDSPGEIIFSFTPKGLQLVRGVGEAPARIPKYTDTVRERAGDISFNWGRTHDQPGERQQELEREVRERLAARADWIMRVTALVDEIEGWVKELGWSTRRIRKQLDDPYVGRHAVCALLMQEDTVRILLEPVGRSAPGVEGVVDLYLMPAYDDIASLAFAGGRWNLHYLFAEVGHFPDTLSAPSTPLSKETLGRVLAEMKQNAVSA